MAYRKSLPLYAVAAVLAFGVGGALAQAPASIPPGAIATAPAASSQKKPVTKKRPTSATQAIPLETAPPTAPTAASQAAEARQRVADQQVLQQQQAQSAAAAQATDQQVQRAQQRVDQQQREVRIQDAPGPAQTGVPGPGGLTQPVNPSQGIQDAPGPAQTLPQVPAAQPATTTAPSTTNVPQPVPPSASTPPEG